MLSMLATQTPLMVGLRCLRRPALRPHHHHFVCISEFGVFDPNFMQIWYLFDMQLHVLTSALDDSPCTLVNNPNVENTLFPLSISSPYGHLSLEEYHLPG